MTLGCVVVSRGGAETRRGGVCRNMWRAGHAEARRRGEGAFGDVLLLTLLVISSLAWRAISLKYAELSVTRRRGASTLASFHAGCPRNRCVESPWLARNDVGVHAEARRRGEGAFGDVLLLTLLVISSLAWRAISVKYVA
jgi:hypothetical protein